MDDLLASQKASIRALFFKGGARRRQPLDVIVTDESGVENKLEFDIVGLSVGDRGRILTTCMTSTGNEDEDEGEEAAMGEKLDIEKMTPALIIAGTFLRGTDTQVFSEEDRDALNMLDASYVDQIVTVVTKLSGITKKAAGKAEGNSAATAS